MSTRARQVAEQAHEGQSYGDEPYTAHLDAVVEVLGRFGFTHPDFLAAGYLHDTLEDTDLTKAELVAKFGPRVANLVDACTDGEGVNRKARKERPYRLIPRTPGALAVKLADRVANVEAAKASGSKIIKMYRKEHTTFRERLYDTAYAAMFDHIEGLLV